jgi:hypothetical protein
LLGTDLISGGVVSDRASVEQAYELLKRAVSHPHSRPRYHFSLARALGYLGKTHEAEAREEARLLVEHWPDSLVARQCAAAALHRIDMEAANAEYAISQELSPAPKNLTLTPVMLNNSPPAAGSGPASRPREREAAPRKVP